MSDLVPSAKKPNLFQKGQSGNPAGRPKGSKNAISIIKLQIEGEMRSRLRPHMGDVVDEMLFQALPRQEPRVDSKGNPVLNDKGEQVVDTIRGSSDMLKTLFGAWVSKSKSSEDDAPKEKIQIVIGKLDQVPPITGKVFTNQTTEE